MTARRFRIGLIIIVVLTLGRVATTHRVFSQTADEAIHLAAGYDLLVERSWRTDIHHPNLARVFFGLPFIGVEPPITTDAAKRGNALLLNGRYERNLAKARFGNLLFLALGVIGVARWGSFVFDRKIGLTAAALFALLPLTLAHAGLATTDMAAAATFVIAADALTRFLNQQTWRRTMYLGLAVAAGILAKYSFFAYFPMLVMSVVGAFLLRERTAASLLSRKTFAAIAITVLVTWLGFGCDFGTLIDGIEHVRQQNRGGHPALLFNEKQFHGWWYYFPVALSVKTPIAFLLLALAGCVVLLRRRPEIPLMALALLGVAMTSHINLGIRHLLPMYAPLAICAAVAVFEWRRLRLPAALLVAWLVVDGARAHPDYLPWFNAFAPRPELVLNDSNLDWGQDLLRLRSAMRKHRVEQFQHLLFTYADLPALGFPPHVRTPRPQPVEGWFAISEFELAMGLNHSPEVRRFLTRLIDGQPYERVGKSIRLYYFGTAHPTAW